MSPDAFFADLTRRLLEWAETQPEIRLVMVVGSQARQVQPADEYSDLDLSLYITDGASCQTLNAYLAWMRDFAPVWMILEDHHDETKSWLILYRGGLKVDFSVTPVGALQSLIAEQRLWDDQQRGYTILVDRDGMGPRLPRPTPFEPPSYTPPRREQFVHRVETFFYGAVYVARQIRRGNLWKVKWADQIQQSMLLEMLEWHAHATNSNPVDTYNRGDFMRDWVSATTWQELHAVSAHFDVEDSSRALLASIRLFTRLTVETAAALGYDCPRTMIAEVMEYIEGLVRA
ncbi:MAG: aminoglycoside 6-adenylyltransferase [Chloroflexi bacterium]|nr:aminoglycoside 6-adenylyltransferase [Chloroflexota bacterium]